ncbi:MAG: GDSL-type esterase/lipase family protein [Clostridia bacterium]
MRPLEIVLVSISGVLIFSIIIFFIVNRYYVKFKANKVTDYKILNQYAPNRPIVFLGDSLTDFFPIQEYLHCDKICNRGIAGETSLDVFKRISDITILNPSTLFLLIGANDVLYEKKLTPIESIKRIDNIIKSFDQSTRIIVSSLYPINRKAYWISRISCKHANNIRLQAVNTLLKQYCADNHITYIDVYPHLCDENGNLSVDFSVEGLHLSANGYKIITKLIEPYIKDEQLRINS